MREAGYVNDVTSYVLRIDKKILVNLEKDYENILLFSLFFNNG